jgi:hypothetical protein
MSFHLKKPWSRPMLTRALDPVSCYTLKRLGVRLAILLAFALAQIASPWGSARALMAMSGFTVLICAGFAVFTREKPFGRSLGYWDEGIFFLLLFAAVRLFSQVRL